MTSHRVHPVILCGGVGSRLWPESTPSHPKAFLALTGPLTLLQETALRVAKVAGVPPPIVVASAAHGEEVLGEFADVGVACRLVTEPAGRGSAAAVAVACLEIAEQDPEGVVLIAACDHHVPDTDAFAGGVAAAIAAAAGGAIVTFGVTPTNPSSAYGYVRPGAPLEGAVRAAAGFVEKPSTGRAEELIADGWLWNSGVFVFRADVMLGELAAREPALLAAARRARAEAIRRGDRLALGEAFLAAPSLAIDVAVMERTERAAVLPIAYAWSDLGAWDSVLEAAEKDSAGNAVRGRVKLVDSQRCLIRADAGVRIVAVGLRDIAVVVDGGRVLVTDLAAAQSVRAAADGVDED